MHHLIELYSPKPAWAALTSEERRARVDMVRQGAKALADLGVSPSVAGRADPAIARAPGHMFFAIWSAPDAKALGALTAAIEASGWYELFEQINVGGPGEPFDTHLDDLAAEVRERR